MSREEKPIVEFKYLPPKVQDLIQNYDKLMENTYLLKDFSKFCIVQEGCKSFISLLCDYKCQLWKLASGWSAMPSDGPGLEKFEYYKLRYGVLEGELSRLMDCLWE